MRHDRSGPATRRPRLALAAAVALSAAAGSAQVAPPPAEAGDGQAVVVTGARDRQPAVRAYVDEVSAAYRDQLAKFSAPICPASFGLPAGHNEAVATRLREIAEALGIGSAPAGCRPNVVVIVAGEGGDFLARLRRERPQLFAAFELAELREIMALAGPVRSWQAVDGRGADGRPLERISWLEVGGGPPRFIPRGHRLGGVMPSLTQRSTRQDVALSFIVFDLDAIEGLTLLQIADYAALRTLARTEPADLPERRSILTLFGDRESGRQPAGELTEWDVAYLRALYRTGNNVSARQQRSTIARAMRRQLDSAPDSAVER